MTQSALSCIEWILFDAVGTLIEPDPPVAEAYVAVGRRFGSSLTEDEVDRRFREAFDEFEQADLARNQRTSEPHERQRWREIVFRVFDDLDDREPCFDALWQHFGQSTAWRCFADVEPALSDLSAKGIQIGVASNFDERLHHVLTDQPFERFLSLTAVSSTIGHRKPAGQFFAAIENRINATPGQILYVGDNPETDIVAARAAGWSALQIDRDSSESSADSLTNLNQLHALLPPCPNGSPSSETPCQARDPKRQS